MSNLPESEQKIIKLVQRIDALRVNTGISPEDRDAQIAELGEEIQAIKGGVPRRIIGHGRN
jgi:3,4-dihydroxy-2-butanone 4-phosphate synthase